MCPGAGTLVTRVGAVRRAGRAPSPTSPGTAGLLGWDRETLMPPAGAEGRARQLGTLAALHHRELVRADAGAAIDALRERRRRSTTTPARCCAWRRASATGRCACPRRWCARSPRPARAASRRGSRRGRPTTSPPTPGRCARVVELKRREAEAIGDRRRALRRPPRRVRAGRAGRRASSRSSPTCASGWPRSSPRPPPREPAELPPRGLARGRPDGARRTTSPRWWASTRRPGVIARSAHPFTGSPHAGDVRFTTRLDRDEPAEQHRRGDARAGPRPLRAGPARRRSTARPLHDAPSLGRPRVAVALLGEPDRPHAGVLGARSSPPCGAASPRR